MTQPSGLPVRERIFQKKTIAQLIEDTCGEHSLKRVLSRFEIVLFGIGAVIGTGIFVITGIAAAKYSGPALVISFLIAGMVCLVAALCYAEFAAMVPVAGSAYTYSYASLGEIWAWIIGWDLILEYSVAVAAVAIGWSAYMVNLLKNIGLVLPPALVNPPGVEGGIINLPAIVIIALITCLLITGVKGSARFNAVIVLVKVAVILLFLYLGFSHINMANYIPFFPFGWQGVVTGAAIVFFAYIGFDAVSTSAEEVKDPQKDLPFGIITALVICTILYVAVAIVLCGIVPYYTLNNAAPVANALDQIGITWGGALVSVGALFGITSVILVLLFGQTRIFFAMARDGLLPKGLKWIHPVLRTPVRATLIVAVGVALMSSLLPLQAIAELVNIGTLAAFILVSAGIIVLRRTQPGAPRPFKAPFVPLLPLVCIGFCFYLILALPTITHIRFIVWLIIGLIVYALYSARHSRLYTHEDVEC
jgi:basic amino acid/polyamine antiporter, APA family